MHGEALAPAAALFVVFAFLGYPIVAALLDTTALQRMLLAPVAGLCASTAVVATLNHLGFPVGIIGRPVLWITLAAAALFYIVRRPHAPWRTAWPFLVLIALGLGVAGWPMAFFGSDWLAYGNDDMATYVLGGNHFFSHGYFQIPPASELLNERDPSWNTSFYYSYTEIRYAAPLMLAWVMTVAGLSAGPAFMPMIVALHLIVITSAAGLVAARGDGGRAAFIACLLLAVSANLLSGTLRQLLPQDFGLAVLAAAAATLLRPAVPAGRALIRRAVLGSLFTGTLVIAYPEVLPFFVVPAVLYAALSVFRRPAAWRGWAMLGAALVVGTLLVANEGVPGAVDFFAKQVHAATPAGAAENRDLFAEMLTPLAFSILWGLGTVGAGLGPWTVVPVFCGLVATAGAAVAAVRYSVAMEATAIVLLVMLATFAQLMLIGAGFGVFKLAMFVQPFLLGTVACSLVDFVVRRPAPRTA